VVDLVLIMSFCFDCWSRYSWSILNKIFQCCQYWFFIWSFNFISNEYVLRFAHIFSIYSTNSHDRSFTIFMWYYEQFTFDNDSFWFHRTQYPAWQRLYMKWRNCIPVSLIVNVIGLPNCKVLLIEIPSYNNSFALLIYM